MAKNRFSKNKFEKKNLPTNRKEMFFDIFKLHYFSLIKIGLILLAFLIPLLVVNYFIGLSYILEKNNYVQASSFNFILSVVKIPCLLLLAIPLSGLGKILKSYVWMEPVFFKEDFKQGIKDNIKPTLISLFIAGTINVIFAAVYYLGNNGWISAIPFGFSYLIIYPILIHTLFINFVYTNKYFKNFKLGMYFYLKHLPSTLLFSIILFAYKALDIIHFANSYMIAIKVVIFVILIIFLLPLYLVGLYLNEMRIFDKRINNEKFPNLVNKGLYKGESDN